jgi:hypothetical protein
MGSQSTPGKTLDKSSMGTYTGETISQEKSFETEITSNVTTSTTVLPTGDGGRRNPGVACDSGQGPHSDEQSTMENNPQAAANNSRTMTTQAQHLQEQRSHQHLPMVMKRGRFLVNTADNTNFHGASSIAPPSSSETTFTAESASWQGDSQSLPGLSSALVDQPPKVTRRGRFSVLETSPDANSVSTPTTSNHRGVSAMRNVKHAEVTDPTNILPVFSVESSANTQQQPGPPLPPTQQHTSHQAYARSSTAEHVEDVTTFPSVPAVAPTIRQKKGRFIVENVPPGFKQTASAEAAPGSTSKPSADSMAEAIPAHIPLYDDSDVASTITTNTGAHEPQLQQQIGVQPASPAITLPTVGLGATNTGVASATIDKRYVLEPAVAVTATPVVSADAAPASGTANAASIPSTPFVITLDHSKSAPRLMNPESVANMVHNSSGADAGGTPQASLTASLSPEVFLSVTNTYDGTSPLGGSSSGVTKKGRFVVLSNSQGPSSISGPVGLVSSTLGMTPVNLTATAQPSIHGSTATMGVLTTSTPMSVMSLPPTAQLDQSASATHTESASVLAPGASNARATHGTTVWQGNAIVLNTSSPKHTRRPISNGGGDHKNANQSAKMSGSKSNPALSSTSNYPRHLHRGSTAPCARGTTNGILDMQSLDARRANGVGRISRYLEEMKTEVEDFDNMNRALQTHVKIFVSC